MKFGTDSQCDSLAGFDPLRFRFYSRWILVFAFFTGSITVSAQEPNSGQSLYRALCANCHGQRGQGSAEFDQALSGDLDVVALAKVIQETMPENKPGSLTDQQADQIARYIYAAFYSPSATLQAPRARMELAHLTVEQYRQTVMDLVDSMIGQRRVVDVAQQSGLTAEYFDGQTTHNQKRRKLMRVDSLVDFDFGDQTAVEELADPRRFSIRWSGSVFAPETGNYTFAVHSDHAVKFYLNSREARIDAWVKSAGENEHVADVFLVGGRRYPLLLEFSKSKQGVDDSKKNQNKPPVAHAGISLKWKRPHGVLQTIPNRYLSPTQSAIRFVCSTRFPPDDRSYGWIRGTSVSKEWDRATTSAALQATAYLTEQLRRRLKSDSSETDLRNKLQQYSKTLMERAFRSPLDPDTLRNLIDRPFAEDADPEEAFKRVALYTFKSPRFLFREIEQPASHRVASRLAFGLWNSLPDETLLKAARDNQLESRESIEAQVQRMLRDPRTTQKLREFLFSWLQVDIHHELVKDESSFPGFDQTALDDMRASLELTIDEMVRSDEFDFRQLLGSREVYLNTRLAKLFLAESDALNANHADNPESSEFFKVRLDSDYRAGVLTHPYILAQFAYRNESSPIHRGVFVARNVLGTRLRPPPEAFAPLSPQLHADLTTRQRVALQTKPAQCMSCHQTINPLGFAFENFDAVGKLRTADRGQPIDASAAVELGDQVVEIQNARQLVDFVINDPQSQAAFCEQLFHFLIGQSINAYGQETREQLRVFFAEHQFNIRQLAKEIVVVSAMMNHQVAESNVTSTPSPN